MTAIPVLKFTHVSVNMGDKCILKDLSFEVAPGELVAIIGPSGSGKSSLMKTISRVMPLSQGEILIKGQALEHYQDNKAYAHQVGMLHQQFDLVENLEVVHNVLAGRLNEWGFWKSLWSLIKPQDLQLAKDALTAVGLADKLNETTAVLSGGEQQRVAIARLLVQNPSLILADEPISALDPANAHIVLRLLTDLARQHQQTLIASMHAMDYAQAYFDRIIGLKQGELIFDESTQSLTDRQIKDLFGMMAAHE